MYLHAQEENMKEFSVRPAKRGEFEWLLLEHHYAKRVPSVSHSFVMVQGEQVVGVVTFGAPASRHIQIGACPSDPASVIELNRLCVLDSAPTNSESWFLAKALRLLPPYIVVSYADTVQGHMGYVYRAANFRYAGWTDMERKTPRYDYIVPGKHTRQAFRDGVAQFTEKVRRRPKVKYWLTTGDRKEQHRLSKACGWPSLCWKKHPPPTEHQQLKVA